MYLLFRTAGSIETTKYVDNRMHACMHAEIPQTPFSKRIAWARIWTMLSFIVLYPTTFAACRSCFELFETGFSDVVNPFPRQYLKEIHLLVN